MDKTKDGFSAYDAYALLNYQYLAASFDGAGWLPLASYEAEVEATYKPMERLLEADPDALCGQIIFQKDGYNMARRSPVADGLEKQLEVLMRHAYRVVSVSQLLRARAQKCARLPRRALPSPLRRGGRGGDAIRRADGAGRSLPPGRRGERRRVCGILPRRTR